VGFNIRFLAHLTYFHTILFKIIDKEYEQKQEAEKDMQNVVR